MKLHLLQVDSHVFKDQMIDDAEQVISRSVSSNIWTDKMFAQSFWLIKMVDV